MCIPFAFEERLVRRHFSGGTRSIWTGFVVFKYLRFIVNSIVVFPPRDHKTSGPYPSGMIFKLDVNRTGGRLPL